MTLGTSDFIFQKEVRFIEIQAMSTWERVAGDH